MKVGLYMVAVFCGRTVRGVTFAEASNKVPEISGQVIPVVPAAQSSAPASTITRGL